MEENQSFVQCQCGSHGVVISEFIDRIQSADNLEVVIQEFHLDIFNFGHNNIKIPFLERLKYAWKHLRTGQTTPNSITMSRADAEQLTTFLIDRLRQLDLELIKDDTNER